MYYNPIYLQINFKFINSFKNIVLFFCGCPKTYIVFIKQSLPSDKNILLHVQKKNSTTVCSPYLSSYFGLMLSHTFFFFYLLTKCITANFLSSQNLQFCVTFLNTSDILSLVREQGLQVSLGKNQEIHYQKICHVVSEGFFFLMWTKPALRGF